MGWGLSTFYFSTDTDFGCGLRPFPIGTRLPVSQSRHDRQQVGGLELESTDFFFSIFLVFFLILICCDQL